MDIEIKIDMLCAIALHLPDKHPLIPVIHDMLLYMIKMGYDIAHISTGYMLVDYDY